MIPTEMRRVLTALLFSMLTHQTDSAIGFSHQPDTLPRQSTPQQPAKPVDRQAPAPRILPGTRLDPRFRSIPAQDPAVAKAAPAWLRAGVAGSPTYVIDGNVATAAQLRRLRPADVASKNVLSSAKATRLYGKNARNGLVLVTTRAALKPKRN